MKNFSPFAKFDSIGWTAAVLMVCLAATLAAVFCLPALTASLIIILLFAATGLFFLLQQRARNDAKQIDAPLKQSNDSLPSQEADRFRLLQVKALLESEAEQEFVQRISDYYQGIFVVNLNTDETQRIKVPTEFGNVLDREHNRLSPTLLWYMREQIDPEYAPVFQRVTQYNYLRRELQNKDGMIDMTYRKKDGTWIGLRIFTTHTFSKDNPSLLWVFEDDTATVNLRRQEEAAQITAQAAQAANEAKTQFLANMSHEIRTPLNAILGMSELGLRDSDNRTRDECFRDIRLSGRNLLESINSILDLSKIEAGKMEISEAEYQIQDVIHDIITVLRIRAKEKKLDFYSQVDESIPKALWGDEVNLSHIIMNLGGNAVKYTPEGGSVTISFTWEPENEENGWLDIHVEDSGIGIRNEDMPYLFQSFGRVDQKANRHIEGTGLGLPICKNLTDMMHGQLGVESTYGVGSDFWVRIPQKVVDPAPCGPYHDGHHRENSLRYHSFTAPDAVVLIVDDQTVNLRVCRGLLSPYKMQVFTASTGMEALQQMTQVWPDVVFMDHMMPEMDGVETTKRIRAMGDRDPYFSVVPIIALTANAMKGVKDYFLENGFNDFISKPMELHRLDEALRYWLPGDKQDIIEDPAETPADYIPADLIALKGIDVRQGIAYCGTADLYRKTLITFREQLPVRSRAISLALADTNLENFVIEVHGLKSAARWVGLSELGDAAEALETAGKNGDMTTLLADTAPLLLAFRAIGDTLASL